MNPYKLKNVFEYLTSNNQLLKKKLKLGTSEIPIPPKRQDVIDVEVINRFNKANPRVDTTNLQPLSVKQSDVKQSNVGQTDDGFLDEALGDYNNYLGMRKARPPKKRYKEIPFKKFLGEYSKENRADGGRIGYDEGSKLTDFVDVQASGSKTGKQQIEGAPKGITADSETINAIIKADIPVSEKINLLATYGYGKGRTRIDYKDQEIFLDEGGYKDRNVGIDFNRDGDGFSGSANYGIDTGEPQLNIKYKKSFADGGMLVQPSDDGSRPGYKKDKINMPPNRAGKFSSESIDNVSDAFLKSYADDDIQILFEKNKSNPNGLISATDSKAGIFTKITTNENYLQAIVKNTGLDKETILNMIEDRDAFTALEKTTTSQDVRFADRKKFVVQAEKWLLNNGKRYADPVKFEKAFARTFGKNNLITKAIKANITGARDAGRPTINFSADFVSDIMGGAQGIDKETVKKGKAYAYSSNQLEQMFKTVIYNQNENVKNRILKTFEDIMPEPGSKRTPDLRDIFNNNALLKKFGLNKSITGPIARLLAKEINEDLLNNIKNFQKPYLGTTDLVRFLKDKVNPKYKSMFEEAAKATAFAQKNNWPQAKEALNMSDSIMFDHKVPKALVDAGYADEIEYIKLNPTSAEFNRTIKRTQFDQPMIKLTNEFERTKSLDAKAKVVEKMNTLKNNFSKKYGGYLDEVSIIPDKTGKPIFKSSAAPVTKQTDFVSSLGKSMVQAGEITTKDQAKLLRKMGFKCKFAGSNGGLGSCDDPASYFDDINKTQADINSSDINVRNKAIVKNRKALQIAKTIPKIGKFVQKAAQVGASIITTPLKAFGLTSPIGLAIEGAIEGGIYDYYRAQGYNHDQAYAETFTPKIATDAVGITNTGVGAFEGAQTLLDAEKFGAVQYDIDGNEIGIKTGNPKGLAIQYDNLYKNYEKEFNIYANIANSLDQIKSYGGIDSNNLEDQLKIQEVKVNQAADAIKPGTPAYEAFQIAEENQAGRMDNRKKEYLEETRGISEPSEFQIINKDKQRMKDMISLYPQYTDEQMSNYIIDSGYDPQEFKDNMTTPKNFPGDTSSKPISGFQDVEDYVLNQQKTQSIADAGGVANMASGGIASLTDTIPPESGPTPQGLPYVYNNVKKI